MAAQQKMNGKSIQLKNMLVVMICIENYDSGNNVSSIGHDKRNLADLWENKYGYKVLPTIKTESDKKDPDKDDIPDRAQKTMTKDEMIELLNVAQEEFCTNNYDGIIICFSGHGNGKYLACSDGAYPRTEFTKYFNGNNCPNQLDKYKIYLVNSRRGKELAKAVEAKEPPAKGNAQQHPEANKMVINAQAETYKAHGDKRFGSHMMRAVVDVFKANLKINKMEDRPNFNEIIDDIKDKSAEYSQEYGICAPEAKTIMKSKTLNTMKFDKKQ